MSFTVRIFAHRGLDPLPILEPKQATVETVYALSQPYLWRQAITASATAASSTANTTVKNVGLLRIEIPDGQSIRYEVNGNNRTVTADANSPILSGNQEILFEVGQTISIIDASGT